MGHQGQIKHGQMIMGSMVNLTCNVINCILISFALGSDIIAIGIHLCRASTYNDFAREEYLQQHIEWKREEARERGRVSWDYSMLKDSPSCGHHHWTRTTPYTNAETFTSQCPRRCLYLPIHTTSFGSLGSFARPRRFTISNTDTTRSTKNDYIFNARQLQWISTSVK